MKKLDDKQVETSLRSGNKDILVYLYEKNYKAAKAYVIKHGGSEGDVDSVLKDAIELLWDHYQGHGIDMRGDIAELISYCINEAWQRGEAKRYISRNTRIKHYYLRMYNRKTAGILILLFIAISVPLGWIYMENFFSEQNHITVDIDSLKQEDAENKGVGTVRQNNHKPQNAEALIAEGDTSFVSSDSLSSEKRNTDESNNKLTNRGDAEHENVDAAENMVIKKDILLFSKWISIIEKSKENSSNGNVSKELLEKLNPEGHLPEEQKTAKNISVEFWKSPVNYKGYKLSRNKIILFGVEDADRIKLYNIDENMYLEFGADYFLLESNQDFKPLIKVRDSNILSQLSKL